MPTNIISSINRIYDADKLSQVALLNLDGYDPSKKTIVILDDYESILTMFKKLIKRMGICHDYNIIYGSGQDASLKAIKTVSEVKGFKIDYLLTDITFGTGIRIGTNNFTVNGVRLVGILFRFLPNLKYTFMTGHMVSPSTTPELYIEYANYDNGDLLDKVKFKDKPITMCQDFILDMME